MLHCSNLDDGVILYWKNRNNKTLKCSISASLHSLGVTSAFRSSPLNSFQLPCFLPVLKVCWAVYKQSAVQERAAPFCCQPLTAHCFAIIFYGYSPFIIKRHTSNNSSFSHRLSITLSQYIYWWDCYTHVMFSADNLLSYTAHNFSSRCEWAYHWINL